MDVKQYTKLFNYGYFLSKFESGFLKNLLKATNEVDELKSPITAGKAQFDKDQILERFKENLNEQELDLDQDFEPDI